MEQITYQEQIFWGLSLNMANTNEIDVCYNCIKKEIVKNHVYFSYCVNAESEKRNWLCGNSTKKYPLCGENNSILKAHLIETIKKMVTTKVNIDPAIILKTLKKEEYIDIYPCNRVFFIK